MMQDALTDDARSGEYSWSAIALGSIGESSPTTPSSLALRAAGTTGQHVAAAWYPAFKRAADLVFSVAFLICLVPLFLVVALLIKLDSSGPVLFRQERVGRYGRRFQMLKFRSMRCGAEAELRTLISLNEADGPLFKIHDDPRVTRVGRVLRRYSIDELPQLINVLRGDMSLVGPRPPLRHEVEQYLPWQRQRLNGVPGLTGLWQISGRSDLSFDEGVALDLQYLTESNPLLDLSILARTVPAVLRSRGAY